MNDATALEHDHTPEGIRERLSRERTPNYLRDWIYGGIDGTVTTFAIVAGVAGASLPTGVLLVLGLANLAADGFSMAASNYSGTKTEVDDYARLAERERRHIRLHPEGEKEEIRQLLARKGLSGDTLEEAVAVIAADEATWIDMMMSDEYGLSATMRDPRRAALSTFAAFVLCGLVPLIPFLVALPLPFLWSALATCGVFFAIGSAKSHWSLMSWWRSGAETLVIGAAAAAAAFLVGYGLREIAGIAA